MRHHSHLQGYKLSKDNISSSSHKRSCDIAGTNCDLRGKHSTTVNLKSEVTHRGREATHNLFLHR